MTETKADPEMRPSSVEHKYLHKNVTKMDVDNGTWNPTRSVYTLVEADTGLITEFQLTQAAESYKNYKRPTHMASISIDSTGTAGSSPKVTLHIESYKAAMFPWQHKGV